MSSFHDTQELMVEIARLANMEMAYIKRMVLVLDIDDSPRLYVETFLDGEKTKGVSLPDVPIVLDPGPCPVTTTDAMRKFAEKREIEYRESRRDHQSKDLNHDG